MTFPNPNLQNPNLPATIVIKTSPQVSAIKISDAVGRLKTVRPDGNVIRTAQALGISLGN